MFKRKKRKKKKRQKTQRVNMLEAGEHSVTVWLCICLPCCSALFSATIINYCQGWSDPVQLFLYSRASKSVSQIYKIAYVGTQIKLIFPRTSVMNLNGECKFIVMLYKIIFSSSYSFPSFLPSFLEVEISGWS